MADAAIVNFPTNAIMQPPVEIHLQNLQKYQQLQPETGHVTKTGTGSKFNMAAADMLNSVKHSYSVTIHRVRKKTAPLNKML